jgi:proteasome lid subunit RPN8/RPN11
VDADWSWTLSREEKEGDVMGFYHTHPDGFGAQPSRRDIRTMQAWCSALGKPLLCLIAEESKPGIPKGYVFTSDEHPGQPVESISEKKTGVYLVRESERTPEAK